MGSNDLPIKKIHIDSKAGRGLCGRPYISKFRRRQQAVEANEFQYDMGLIAQLVRAYG